MDNSFGSRPSWPGMANGMPPQAYAGNLQPGMNPRYIPDSLLQPRGTPISEMNGFGGFRPPISTPSSMGGPYPMWDMDVPSQMFMQTLNFERMMKQHGMGDMNTSVSLASMRTEDVTSRSEAGRDLIEQQQAMEQARLLQRFKELRQWQQQQQEMLMSQQQQQLGLLRKEQERMQGMIAKQRDSQWGGGQSSFYADTETPPRRQVAPGMDMSQFLSSSTANESKSSLPKPVMYVQPKEDDDEIKTNPDLFSDTNSNRGSQATVEDGMFPIPDSASEASVDVGAHQMRQGQLKSMSQLKQRFNPHEQDAPKKLHRSFAELEADTEFMNLSAQSPTMLEMQHAKHAESRTVKMHEENEHSEDDSEEEHSHSEDDDDEEEEQEDEEVTDSDENQEETQIEVREDVNIDEIPIKPGIEGGKTFEQLLEEQLMAEEERLKQAEANQDSPSQPKRSFLKKGEGISRFQTKPGQKPTRNKKSKTSVITQNQGSGKSAPQKPQGGGDSQAKQGSKTSSKPPTQGKASKQTSQKPPNQAGKQQKQDQKNKKTSSKELEKPPSTALSQKTAQQADSKPIVTRADSFPDDASFVANLKERQKESERDMEDLDEFEILEQFADNMSFCSNSSIVTKGLRGLQNDRILSGALPKSQEMGRPTSPRAALIKKLELEKQAKHREQLEQQANVRKIAPSHANEQTKLKTSDSGKVSEQKGVSQSSGANTASQHKIVRKESRKIVSHDDYDDDDEYESVSDSSDDSSSDDDDDSDDDGDDKHHNTDKGLISDKFSNSGHSERNSLPDEGYNHSHLKNSSVCSTDKKLERALSYTGFTETSSQASESERDIDSDEDDQNKRDDDDDDNEFDFSAGKDDSEKISPSKPLTRKVAKRDDSNKFPFQSLPTDSELIQTSLNVSAFAPKGKSPIVISKEKVSLESNLRHEILKKEDVKFSYHSDSDSAGNKNNNSFSDGDDSDSNKGHSNTRKSFGEKKALQFDDDDEWGELTPKILKARRRKESEGEHDKTLVEENETENPHTAPSKSLVSEKEGEDTPPTSKLVSKLFPSLKPPQKKMEEQNLEKIQAASSSGDGVQSKILRDKLMELEREIEKFRNENKHLANLRNQREQGLTMLKKEISEFEKEKAEELKRIEDFRNEEMKKLKHEKKMFEKYQKAARAGPDKKEREEIETLKTQLNDLQEEMKGKESRWTANNTRLRDRIDQLEQENEELKEEVKILEKKRLEWMQRDQKSKPRSNGETLHRSSTPTEELDQLTNGHAELAYNDLSSSTRSNTSLKPSQQQPKVNIRSSFPPPTKPPASSNSQTQSTSTHTQSAQNKVLNVNQSAKTNVTQSSAKVNLSKKNVSSNAKPGHSMHGHGHGSKAGHKGSGKGNNSVASGKTSNSSDSKNVLRNSLNEDLPRKELGTIAEPQNVSIFSEADGGGDSFITPQNLPRKFARPGVDRSVIDKGDHDSYDEVQHSDGKVERTYKNGAREILFSNGTRKEISADGKSIIVSFFNGDIKQIMPDQRVIYYYAENQTTHTNYPDGLEIIQFPNQQTEKLYPDGTKEITFPDQTIKYIFPNGSEESIFPDGTVIRLEKNGDKTMEFPNGQREIHTQEFKKREYPDGTVKTVYPDGRQETRYSNGRLRVKDKDGNVIVDRQC